MKEVRERKKQEKEGKGGRKGEKEGGNIEVGERVKRMCVLIYIIYMYKSISQDCPRN